jgi:DNA-binding MarR family transcriptional regulator
MTNRVDRLAGKGLVRRLPDPADRRGVIVQLTAEGRARVDSALEQLLMQERRLLGALSASDQSDLADLLRTVVSPFDST